MQTHYRRNFDILTSPEAETSLQIEGKAIVFNVPTLIQGIDRNGNSQQFYEVIDKNALDGCDLSDVPLRSEHDRKIIFARTRNKSLKLDIKADALYIKASLLDNEAGRSLHQQIKAGLLDKMSFAFPVDSESRTEKPIDGIPVRRITKIKKLLDVSIVAYPAYEQTNIEARSIDFDWIVEGAEAFEMEKRKLYLTEKYKY